MRILASIAAAALLAAPATAALAPGAKAPDFATRGAKAGTVLNVKLSTLLKNGPVVLYFFPAAYTGGCNAEAQAFAAAIPQFDAAGATVLGMSANTVEVLKDFSAEKCAGKFTVASAGPKVVAGYDVALGQEIDTPRGKVKATNRTSYVIARNGRIASVHANLSPVDHVKQTLAEVQALKARGA
ncbi:redoxin domain-containing protein [Sphingomonas donggukensis]|uniref:thioredoxin-dependent peroxiredoxin n=1 Tax=Sphingomonas donggukensis TaxID=2949093 RepID=A0ABY4TTK2_9SPHN|nr:redoxin domain-containing protein [Sphingomonas donggukensis]URW75607.1 redoxin domain-containing protein [Sphingomonas donggukensis]